MEGFTTKARRTQRQPRRRNQFKEEERFTAEGAEGAERE
jgi:hypothetical protein